MPEQLIGRIKGCWKREWTLVFAAVFAGGLAAYAFRFLNLTPNWDTMMAYYYPTNNMVHQGRHLQIIGCMFSSFSDIPWITGLLSLCYLAVGMILILDILQLKDRLSVVFLSLIMATFPSVISSFAFMYMADAFHTAMLAAVLAVWLTLRCRLGFLAGAAALCMSMGIYQAYLPFAIALILVYFLDRLLFSEESMKKLGMQALRFLAMGVLGMIFYLVSLRLCVHFEGIAVENHQGMGSMGIPGIGQILSGLIQSYTDTVYFFIGSIRHVSVWQIGNALFFLGAAVSFARFLIAHASRRNAARMLVSCALLLVLPCVAFLFYFLTDEIYYHALMEGALFLFYAAGFLFYEKSGTPAKRLRPVICMAAALSVFACILAANTAYLKMQTSYEKTMSLMSRVVGRMEQLPQYEQAARIAVIGTVPDSDQSELALNPTVVGVTDGYMITHQKHVTAMLSIYFGITLEGVSDEKLEELYGSSRVKQMKIWPAKESVTQIGDIIVIKFGEDHFESVK